MSARNSRPRFLGVFAFVSLALVVFAVACDDQRGQHGRGGGGEIGCGQLTSCGTCTPVAGCGWCETASGEGLCASDPDECASASAFSWTWDPTGCRVVVDAGAVVVVPSDAGTIVVPVDAGIDAPITTPIEASTDAPIDAPINPSDAADGS